MAPKQRKCGKKSVGKKEKSVKKVEKKGKSQEIIITDLKKSVLMEEEFQKLEKQKKIPEVEVKHEESKKTVPLFYKNFVMRCKKCIEEFKHKAYVPTIEQKVKCPKCNEVHVIRIVPEGGIFKVEFPEHLEVVLEKKENQKA
ncbi:MAG TPA: hypothetical protein ENG50_02995 [Candidatus Altiarchaeales archaeon]|nr:hypothetical protein [Candidatus Altiarchaeales archaeon]